MAKKPGSKGSRRKTTDGKTGARGALSVAVAAAERAKRERARTAEVAIARMGRLRQQITELFYDLALELETFRDKKLHLALGYATFDDCLAERRIVGPDVAQKLLAIVDGGVSRETALEYGSYERAYASLRLTRKTKRGDDSPATLLEEGKRIGGVPAAEAPIRAYEAEMRELDAKQGTRPAKLSAAQQKVVDAASGLHLVLDAIAGVESDVRPKHGKTPGVLVELSLESATALRRHLER